MVLLINMHSFLRSCNHLILLKVEGVPASQNCRCDRIDKLNINEVLVSEPLVPSCLYISHQSHASQEQMQHNSPTCKANKWIMRFNTTRVHMTIYTQKCNALLRRRPLPTPEIVPTYHHFCQIRKHGLYLFCTFWSRLDSAYFKPTISDRYAGFNCWRVQHPFCELCYVPLC